MAKKNRSRVSIRKLEEAAEGQLNQVSTLEWNGIEIEVRRNIGMGDACAFVDFMRKACFSDDGEYLPEAKEPAFRALVVRLYTNITMPSNAAKQYDILMHTDLVPQIVSRIDGAQLGLIIQAIDEKIEYACKSNIDFVKKQMTDASKAIETLLSDVSSVFSGVSQDDIAKLASAMANGGLDEQKLMQAYLEQKYDQAQADKEQVATYPSLVKEE